jgi:hypothetical protein
MKEVILTPFAATENLFSEAGLVIVFGAASLFVIWWLCQKNS